MRKTVSFVRHTALAAALALGIGLAGTASAAGPVEILKQRIGEVSTLLKKATEPGTPAHRAKQARVKKIIRSFLSYEELAKQSLWMHWKDRSPTERREFTELLRQLIEDRVLSNLSSTVEFNVEYGEAVVDGDKATVKTTVRIPEKPEVDIEYKFGKLGNRWLVHDILTDGTSLVRNYRSQFNRIIQRDGFPSLVQKMKDKLHNDNTSGKLADAARAG